ncbi:MAG: phosphoribosylglycinamide formyltransferase [Hyphomicrobiales bacterium]|nr:MAG: phosphoribosylglycinamide formyltransferase [Hyphomicrobiales bacterium]
MGKKRVAILISGRGSNMAALLEAARDPDYPAEIAVVIANRPDAKGLETAAAAGIATSIVDHKHYPNREAFEDDLTAAVSESGADIVCLAGFMRLLTPHFVERWRDRMINIHPSLLPSFKGLNTHARAIEAGVRLHGCTVHFVRPEMDDGPIIIQAAVPVLSSDSEDTLSERVLAAEHRIYPKALALVASGAVRVVDDRVIHDDSGPVPPPFLWPKDD